MTQLIVRSVDHKFYNVIELDANNNQEVLATDEALDKLQKKYPKLPVIEESEISNYHQ